MNNVVMKSLLAKNLTIQARMCKFIYAVVFLFGFAMLTSKSIISITTIVLFILSITIPQLKKIWISNIGILCIMSLFPLALLTNYFSLAGPNAVLKLILSWYWPLLAAPLYCIYKNKIASRFFFAGLAIGLIFALGKAGLNFYNLAQSTQGFQKLIDPIRISSFWDLGRWGFFLGLSILTLFCAVNENIFKYQKLFLVFLLLITIVFFILSNSRGPLLGLFITLSLIATTDRKIFKLACLLFLVFGLSYFFNSNVSERMNSIFSVHMETHKITSSDASNAGRLHIWKVASDFFKEQPWFGTGFELSESPLKLFISRQDSQYIKEFTGGEFSFSDQHSSYLSLLIQCGLGFSILCWGLVLFLFSQELKYYFYSRDRLSRFCLAGLIYCFVVFAFYSAFLSYECIVFIGLLVLTTRSKNNLILNKKVI